MSEDPRPIPQVKTRHFPPPPPLVSKPAGLWRRTPPSIFPPLLGLLGLGLAWREMAAQPGLHPLAPVGEMILGATLMLYAFALIAWLSKPLRRPGVVIEELSVLPGRAGVVAMVLSLSLSCAAIGPYMPRFALVLGVLAVAALIAVGLLVAWIILIGPAEARSVTPVFHLTFAGYIMAPIGLIPLGYSGFSTGVLITTVAAASAIWLASLRQLLTRTPPAPLRPLMFIHLSPASLFATVSAMLGYPTLALIFGLWAMVVLVALLASARWLLSAGFSPFWGALTFPLAASATAAILGLGPPGLWIGGALLALTSALIPWVAFKVLTAWAKGKLAAITNAATA